VDDGSERRINVVRLAPFAGKAIETFRQWEWAWIEIKFKLAVELSEKSRRRQPIMLAISAVADMKLILSRSKQGLMWGNLRHHSPLSSEPCL